MQIDLSSWQSTRIKEILEIKPRNGLYKSASKSRDNVHRWVKMKDLYQNMVIRKSEMETISVTENEVKTFGCLPDDLLFGRTSLVLDGVGTCSIVGEIKDIPIFESNLFRIRLDKAKAIPLFYLYYFRSPIGRQEVTRIAKHTAAASITGTDLIEIEVPYPSLPEQRAIAGILGALDDKIELNHRMNQRLESMTRAVFRQWFVDGKEVDGWRVGKLGDLCESTIGGDWGEEQEFEDSVPVVCLRGVDLDNLRKDGYSEAAPIRWIKKSSLEKRQLSDCDILIAGSGIGPVGKPLWVSPEMLKAYSYPVIYSNFVKRFRAKSPEYAMYVDRILFNMRESDEIWDYVNGTSIPNLDDKGLLEYSQTPIPPEDKVKAFYEYVKPIYAKLYNKESRTLASLRDSLLPKLMRGEVRVSAL